MSCVRPTIVTDVAALHRGVRQDRNVRRGRAARDLAQEDAARLRQLRELGQRLAVDRLVAHQTSTPSTGTASSSAILDLRRIRSEHLDQHVARARDRDDVAFAQHRVRGRFLDRPVAADALDEDARVGHQRLGLVTR